MNPAHQLVIDEIRGPEAERAFSELEDQAFSVHPPGHYLDDFPIWIASKSAVGTVLRLGAFNGATLVAAAGVRLAELQYPSGPLAVALIGAVATAPAYRGQGLATQLVSLAVEWAEKRGAALAMLWGSEHQLYGKIGFAPCGEQATLPLSSLGVAASEGISTGWCPGIMKALKSRRSGLAIRDVDRAWLSSHENVQWYWTGGPTQVTAFAAMGRGIDLSHYIHEWGGERSQLRLILRHIVSQDPQAVLLGSPSLFAQYGFQYDPAAVESLGLARVIDATSLFKAVYPDTSFSASFENREWKFSLLNTQGLNASMSLGPLEAAQLFFGPVPLGLKKPWSEYFPLPLWFWGLDAV